MSGRLSGSAEPEVDLATDVSTGQTGAPFDDEAKAQSTSKLKGWDRLVANRFHDRTVRGGNPEEGDDRPCADTEGSLAVQERDQGREVGSRYRAVSIGVRP